MSNETCTHVTLECPVSLTLYRHYPNLGVNTFFTVLFATLLIAQVIIGTWKKTCSYMLWISAGCLAELLGYIGRLIMHTNPFNETGLEVQIICLVLAPSFLAAGIYLTLKHIVIYHGRHYSRVRPELYPWIFVSCDVFSIFLQAIGGGVAASGGSSRNESMANTGDDLIIAGISIQIFSMLAFGSVALDYYRSKKRCKRQTDGTVHEDKIIDDSMPDLPNTLSCPKTVERSIAKFYYAMTFAYVFILLRCAYRVHEMAGGWYNSRMRNETLFLLLDGMMVGLASVAITVAHPGLLFPPWNETEAPRQGV